MRGGYPAAAPRRPLGRNFLEKYSDDVVMTSSTPRFVQRAMAGLLARG